MYKTSKLNQREFRGINYLESEDLFIVASEPSSKYTELKLLKRITFPFDNDNLIMIKIKEICKYKKYGK